MARRMAATSRDPEEWSRATEAAREVRASAAAEVAAVLAGQVAELLVAGDMMGGRALLARRLRQVAVAEGRDDVVALRAALVEVAVAAGSWAAAIDFEAPAAENGARRKAA